MSAVYSVRYVHKVAPLANDVHEPVTLPDGAFSNRNTLGKALRDAGVLISGGRVVSFRVEADKIAVFPSVPGMTTYWHLIVLVAQKGS